MDLGEVLRALIRRRQQADGGVLSVALTKAQLDEVINSVSPADYRYISVSRDGVTSIDGAIVWTVRRPVDPFVVSLQELLVLQKNGVTGSK